MNKYKKLAFNTMIFAIGSFGSKILVILLTRLYSRHLDPASSGIKELLEPMALFLQPIFTFALQEYLIRFGLDKKYDKREVFTTSGLITLAGMAVMALMFLGRALLSLLFGTPVTTALGFFTTEVITVLFTLVVLWIVRRLDGVFENQNHYLLRLREEQEKERGGY
ncbi:MAG: hypothetical protein IJJ60_10830 [Clostridia bacterium]|nr:hypothetical protein [Clostridia bacterium]